MRIACCGIVVLSLSLLAGCVTERQSETVNLSRRQSAFDTPLDGRWRKAHESRPIVSRPLFEMHDAHFRWDPQDTTLKDTLAACQGRMLDSDRRTPSPDPNDDDEAIDDAIKDVLPEQDVYRRSVTACRSRAHAVHIHHRWNYHGALNLTADNRPMVR